MLMSETKVRKDNEPPRKRPKTQAVVEKDFDVRHTSLSQCDHDESCQIMPSQAWRLN